MRRKKRNITASKLSIDKPLLWLTVLLATVGILAVSDASAPQAQAVFSDPYYFARQQIVWSIAGFIGLIVATRIHYSYWKKIAFIVGGVSVVLLLAVLIPGIGSKLLGARRWISLGFFALQPSEVAKFGIAITLARLLDEKYPFTYAIGFIGAISMLVMLQPDLGTTIVIAAIGVIQLFIAQIPFGLLAMTGAGGALLAGFLTLTSEYRRARLMTFFESSSDPLGNSYHMRQILIALGSGGLLGVGIGQSRQKHLFLPETATDSVFAIIAEETGFIGSAILIIVLALFMLRIFKIARNAPDRFSQLLVSGIGAWFALQMALNLSSVFAITPLTGIPLPFFSYGGSSLVMVLFAVGIVLNVSQFSQNSSR